MAAYYRATYSKDGQKRPRNRKWLDGYVCQGAGGALQLLDEDGRVLTASKAPAGGGSLASSDLDCFGDSFLVTVDEPCAPPTSGGLASGGKASPPPGPPAQAKPLPPQRPARRDENAAAQAAGAAGAAAAGAAPPDQQQQQSLMPIPSAANRKAFSVPRPSFQPAAAPARPQLLSTVPPAPGARSGKQCTGWGNGLGPPGLIESHKTPAAPCPLQMMRS